jgi:hypothetical protein
MMMMFPKGYETAKPGTLPDLKSIERMRKYNESLGQAGVLLALDGLQPPSMGARGELRGREAEGHRRSSSPSRRRPWAASGSSTSSPREEAIEWAKRVPASEIEVVEVRPFLEISDFPPDVRKALEEMERAAGQPAAR